MSAPRYVIDCASLNRYFWFALRDTPRNFENRRNDAIANHGEAKVAEAQLVFEGLLESGEVISHVEVLDEIRNAKAAAWTRWGLRNRRIFKPYTDSQMPYLYKLGVRDSDFLAKDKPGRHKHADPWVLAQAMERSIILITDDEELRTLAERYGVRSISFWDLPDCEAVERPNLFSDLTLEPE